MRVGVQHPGPGRGAEGEAHQQLAVVVALGLGAVGDHLRQGAGALHPLGDQDGLGGVHDVRDEDVRVLGEGVGERLLRHRLEAVVELLGRAVLELLDQRADVDPGEHGGDAPGQPGQLAEVAHQRLAGAGVLHLDGHVAAVLPPGPVHLADGGGGGGGAVQPDDLLAPVGTEGVLEDLADGLRRHRGGGVLERGEVLAVRRRDVLREGGLEHRQALAELHRAALELAEGAEQLLGRALLDLAQHRLGRLAPQPLAHAERLAAGVPQGQGGQAGGAGHCLAGEVGHGPSVPDGWVGRLAA